jgi:hypothetical protein
MLSVSRTVLVVSAAALALMASTSAAVTGIDAMKSIQSRLEFAEDFLDVLQMPSLEQPEALVEMQRWTDIASCYSWYGWCDAEKLEKLKYRDRLWTCLKDRNVVSEQDDPKKWTKPLKFDFGDPDSHRVFKVKDRFLVVFRYTRYKGIHDRYARFFARLTFKGAHVFAFGRSRDALYRRRKLASTGISVCEENWEDFFRDCERHWGRSLWLHAPLFKARSVQSMLDYRPTLLTFADSLGIREEADDVH